MNTDASSMTPVDVKDLDLADFTAQVNRLYDRQAIAALTTAAGQPFGVTLPPRPVILAAAKGMVTSN